jgi:hypothetical protein
MAFCVVSCQGVISNEVLLVGLGAGLGWAATYFLPGFWAKVARRPPLRIHVEPDPQISMAAYPNWDGYSFHIPRRIDEIGEPPGPVCREWWTWAHGMEGMDAGYTHVRLMVTGLSDMDVVVDALQVRVLDRYDAPAGTTIICATGGADLVPRHIDVDLDHEPPLTEYRDSGGDPTSRFLFTLRKGETEVFFIWARVTQGGCDWVADLHLLVNGKRRSIRVDSEGRPFRTVSSTGQGPGVLLECLFMRG